MANRLGKKWKQWHILFSWAPKSLQMVTAATKLRHLLLGRKAMTNLDNVLKSRDTTLQTKVCLVKAIGEGNGTPLQYSCLENPMDGGAW